MIHFLGIGAQKPSTTWIYQHLCHTPYTVSGGEENRFWDRLRSDALEWGTGLFADDHQRRQQARARQLNTTLDGATIRKIMA
jgi:hypothetical protein